MGQLIARLNTALTSGSWTDEYGNVWTVRNTLKAAEDPDGGNNAIQFSRDATQISTTAPSSMKNEYGLLRVGLKNLSIVYFRLLGIYILVFNFGML